jgi:hypothetical protein
MNMDQSERKALGDVFNRTIRSMNGLPDVLTTKATTVRSLSSVLELSQTLNVQTYRQKDEGDTIFIEYNGVGGCLRLAMPQAVSEVIASQREALTSKSKRVPRKLLTNGTDPTMKGTQMKQTFILLAALGILCGQVKAEDTPPNTTPDGKAATPPALSPEESLKKIHVREGFEVELVASEPLVRSPVAFDWDGQGR